MLVEKNTAVISRRDRLSRDFASAALSDDFAAVFAHDMAAHYPPLSQWRLSYRFRYPVLSWQRRLRKIEAIQARKKPGHFALLHLALLKVLHRRDSVRLGFNIPQGTCGPGLSIAHWGTIAIEGSARLGANARIHQGVTVGAGKNGKAPVIGDFCFLGANCSIIGEITLGNGVTVGAGAVVVKSFGDDVVLVGNPAKPLAR